MQLLRIVGSLERVLTEIESVVTVVHAFLLVGPWIDAISLPKRLEIIPLRWLKRMQLRE
jgi:hypothetical protein